MSAEKKSKNNKSFLIIGFGFEGQCAFKYLRKKYPQSKIAIADQNKIKIKPKNTVVYGGFNYLADICQYDAAIKSPGIPSDLPELKKAREKGVEITTATNMFFAEYRDRIIGVTGTKGKSTTATLIYEILKQSSDDVYLLGNIGGTDPFRFLGNKKFVNSIFIYELSSYQLADLEQSPHIGIFINIFPDHMPYHGTFEKYQAAKTNIASHQYEEDFFIYNSNYQSIKSLARSTKAKAIDYLHICRIDNGSIYHNEEKVLDIKDIKLLGQHNIENIFAVICAVKLFAIKKEAIKKVIADFKGLPHRIELVRIFRGIEFYDDAISTTPESTMAAMAIFKNRLGTMILGGQDRGYDFKELAIKIFESKVDNIVLFPVSGEKIWHEIIKIYEKHKEALPKKITTMDMEAAVSFAFQNTKPAKVCLLSTASPSYSVFKNFEEKGDLFKKYVNGLK